MSLLPSTLRSLTRFPGFVAVAVLTLALGVGVDTALFSILDQVLLRRFDFPDPERLVCLVERSDQTVYDAANYEVFLEWRSRQRSFSAIGAARPWSGDIVGPGEPEQLDGAQVTFDYLQAAGLQPLLGRLFGPEDDQPKAARTVLISEELWARMFGRSDAVLGATLRIRSTLYTIIGVMPRGMIQPTARCAFWVPVAPFEEDYRNHVPRLPAPFSVLARLRPGVDAATAQRDMELVSKQIEQAQPNFCLGRSVTVMRLTDKVFGSSRVTLLVLFGAAGGVLLIACVNWCGLFVVRAMARQREYTIRSALGASRGRIAAHLFAESGVLGLLGLAGGWFLASCSVQGARAWLSGQFPRADTLALDYRALGWAVGVTSVAVLCSTATALWQLRRSEAAGALVARANPGETPGALRWRGGFIIVQLTVTLVLLVGTGLLLRTLARLYQADLGFVPLRVVSFVWSPPLQETRRAEWTARALEQLQALPGVTAVGFISEMPLGGNYFVRPISLDTTVLGATNNQPQSSCFMISPDYPTAAGMRLLRGRFLTAADAQPSAPLAVVIDTMLANKYFPGEDPIGRRLKLGSPRDNSPWREIVGLVAHIENRGVGQNSSAQVYLPCPTRGVPNMAFMVRMERPADAMVAQIRRVMREVAPVPPIHSLATMTARFDAIIAPQRLAGSLVGTFGALGLVLSAIGLFGLLSYEVSLRRREFGIRMALGGTRGHVLRLVFGRTLHLAGAGIAIGLGVAAIAGNLLASLLYETAPRDLASFVGAAALLGLVALLASFGPALDATHVDPAVALRSD